MELYEFLIFCLKFFTGFAVGLVLLFILGVISSKIRSKKSVKSESPSIDDQLAELEKEERIRQIRKEQLESIKADRDRLVQAGMAAYGEEEDVVEATRAVIYEAGFVPYAYTAKSALTEEKMTFFSIRDPNNGAFYNRSGSTWHRHHKTGEGFRGVDIAADTCISALRSLG